MDGSSTTGNPVVDLAVVVLLILVGGFFAASEIALITVKRHRLEPARGRGKQVGRRGSASRRGSEPLPRHDPDRDHLPRLPRRRHRRRRLLGLPRRADRRHPHWADPGRRRHDRLRVRDPGHRPGLDHRRRAGAEDAGAQLSRGSGGRRGAPDLLPPDPALADRVVRDPHLRGARAAPRRPREAAGRAICRPRS